MGQFRAAHLQRTGVLNPRNWFPQKGLRLEFPRKQFPDAKTFGAARPYFADLHAEHLKRERIIEKSKVANVASQTEDEDKKLRAMRRAELDPVWNDLSEAERRAIGETVMAENPRLRLSEFPAILHRLCLDELDKRRGRILEATMSKTM